jgi:hypothetical protein
MLDMLLEVPEANKSTGQFKSTTKVLSTQGSEVSLEGKNNKKDYFGITGNSLINSNQNEKKSEILDLYEVQKISRFVISVLIIFMYYSMERMANYLSVLNIKIMNHKSCVQEHLI